MYNFLNIFLYYYSLNNIFIYYIYIYIYHIYFFIDEIKQKILLKKDD